MKPLEKDLRTIFFNLQSNQFLTLAQTTCFSLSYSIKHLRLKTVRYETRRNDKNKCFVKNGTKRNKLNFVSKKPIQNETHYFCFVKNGMKREKNYLHIFVNSNLSLSCIEFQ